ncbi:S-adenosylmethionine decarboxylase proenzyme [Candidatus Kuenenbacteria bacterium HGW-Kuenenbacteria-1]|uniref:S-adenosylmethionine decarboxylase proenzyme n=1 Tax=Candidatus Kuenenbacteria bacterium HGW-Kuenenbacteria-1 TaxID=2013812 RepID=A0A2N1UNK0_9BACT|nr:MAG: S-adenosylmethionine decarboxylase proenzyme [Candidatus Kuenenbacteria bacterium HGW-Kuenenbacteria-1]
MEALGRHLLLELYDCNPEALNDVDRITNTMTQAALASGATILKVEFHKFAPIGISGMIIIAESHLSIHTWPEYKYAACDVFTCGDKIDPYLAVDYLTTHLEAKSSSIIEMERGIVRARKKII